MPGKNPEKLDHLSTADRSFPADLSTNELDPSAQAAVDGYINDIFNFDLEEPREVQSSERDIATSAVFEHAQQLCTEYVGGADNKVRRQWSKKQRASLPPAEIDGKEFQLSTAFNPKTGAATITMARLNVPDSGFTIVRKDTAATLNLDVSDRPNALDDDQRYDDALQKATDWIDRYAEAIGITPESWLPKTELSDLSEEGIASLIQSTLNRRAEQALRRRGIKKTLGVFVSAIAVTCVAVAGTETILDRHRESNAKFDATHFLPESAPTVHIGESKPVGDGSELDQEIIETADLTNGGERGRVIENAGPHFIRANQEMEVAPKGHATLFSNDCEVIKLEGLGPEGTVKVVALKKDVASNLEAHLDREEMRICNTQTDENASIKLKPRQLYIEITNPQG